MHARENSQKYELMVRVVARKEEVQASDWFLGDLVKLDEVKQLAEEPAIE